MADKIPLAQQIRCVEREIMMRESVYPGRVVKGKMRQGEADYEIAAMQAVQKTLEWLRDNEARIRDAVTP